MRSRFLAVTGTVLVLAMVAGCSASRKSGPLAPNPGGDAAPGARHSAGPARTGEVSAAEDPLSTFAIDVDTASYTYTRRQLSDGRLPQPETVRPEEFVNAFRQDYPQPSGDGFTVTADGARPPEAQETAGAVRLLRVGLQTRAEDRSARADAVLTFVIDVSGSMGEPGRLDLVQDALHTLVDQLRPTDAVAIVTFSTEARVLRPMTPASSRPELHSAIDRLRTEESTNLEAGLVLGYRVAQEGFRGGASNRVILLSDGLANTGNTEAEPILAKVREYAAKKIALLGVGVGSEYGDKLMEQLADEGDGFVVYISEREQARRIFVERLPATLAVRALDAKVQVTFDARAVDRYRLIGYENRAVADEDFRDDRVDGGEVGPGHAVTALYLVRLRAGAAGRVAQAQVRWLAPGGRQPYEFGADVSVADLDRAFGDAPARLRVSCAAGYFAELLRRAPYLVGVRLAHLAAIADGAHRATEDADVRALADLIRRADELRD